MLQISSNTNLKVFERSLPLSLQEYREEVPETFIYECTNSMQYLRQYFFIREYAYRVDLKLQNFSGSEDEIDQYSHFIIARKGHFCIGGARLTISTQEKRVRLPLEHDNFNVRQMLPQLENANYCELGRTALLPDYRDGDSLNRIFELAANIARDFGCAYMVGVSPPSVARRFRNSYQHLGYHTEIRDDISPPLNAIHEHLRLKFILVNLNQSS